MKNVITALAVMMLALSAFAVNIKARENWRETIVHADVIGAGCFETSYPSTVWRNVTCAEAPKVPFGPTPQTVGNGNDYVVKITSGLISKTVGSFPTVTGVRTEEGIYRNHILGTNSYSIQLNSNFMQTPACDRANNPVYCHSWMQFVYSSDYMMVFMQFWLIDWSGAGNLPCPHGWTKYNGDCFINSAAVTVPKEAISNLQTIKMSGSAVKNGLDTLVITVGTKAYSVTAEDSTVYLASAWTNSEFNIVGDGSQSEAVFNNGARITVKVATTNGTTAAPICAAYSGTTGEISNLNLGTCVSTGGTLPYIQFTESTGLPWKTN